MKQIISASRRTDIPAFYGHWFMDRVRKGWAGVINPFNSAGYAVSLALEDVSFIVFWSKNFEPFLKSLDELDEMGYSFYFQFTITGNPDVFEPGPPHWRRTVDTAKKLADRFSPAHVLWRFDPIVLSSITPAEEVMSRFDALSEAMNGAAERCYVSVAQYYRKVLGEARRLNEKNGIEFYVSEEELEKITSAMPGAKGAFRSCVSNEEKRRLAGEISAMAVTRGMDVFSCCCEFLEQGGENPVRKASCVDGDLIRKLAREETGVKPGPTRENCGCAESRDIGAYDTCPHGCGYCYANSNMRKAEENYQKIMDYPAACAMKPGIADEDFSQPPFMRNSLFE